MFGDYFHVLDNKNVGHHHFGSTELYDLVRERDVDANNEINILFMPFPELCGVWLGLDIT